MRSLSVRLLLSLFVVALAVPVFAHDVTITGTTSFAALDGSSNDHDGATNGVFTVNDGNLVINGTVNCNDDSGGDNACSMAFAVSGNLTINSGAALYAENRTGAGTGGAITMTVGGNLAMNGTAIVSTSSKSSSGAAGGNVTANVGGSVTLANGTIIDAGSANAKGGDVTIAAGSVVTLNGAVLSGPSRTLLSTRLTGAALDGGTSNQQGGAITITSSTFAEPAVLVGSTANIIAQGETNGAGPVTIDGCGIQVYGLIAALSRKDAPAKIAIRSGKDVLIDARDLGVTGATTGRLGRVRADAPSGTAVNKGVDIFAAETIDLLGPSPSASIQYSVTSIPGQHDAKSYGGLIRVMSLEDVVNASGLVIDDGHTASGDTGGTIEVSSKGNANLAGAYIRAIGDFNTNNGNRGGGSISIRSYSGDVIWTNGLGEVRPVGSTSGLTSADQGKIVINACGSINTTGTSFPIMGTATSVFPETHTGVCSPAAPSLPAGVPVLVTCNTPPVANDTSASTLEDHSVTITLTGSDADGDPLTFSIVSGPSHGTVSSPMSTGPTSATVVYTPALDYNGTDSFTFRADDGNGGTDDAVATVTITPVNDAPSFQIGPTATALEDSGAQTYANWATAISAGPADESGQTVTFTVTNDNPSLFSVQPAVASNGTLTYTPAANAYGTANVTVVAHDNGGTANGGVDTSAAQTSSIAITGVNDAPSFTGGGNVTVLEDSGAYSASWASAISAGPNETQNVSFVATNDNNALFASQPAVDASGTLTFTPAANANGSATVTVYAQDDGGTANGGVATSAPQTFTISVTAVNDAPSFTSGGDVTVLEDSAAYSAAWATAISAGPSDESGQTLTFSASNSNNALFATQPAISASGVLTFTLAANAFGSATVTVTLSDDGGTANSGADTSAAQTFTINVTGVNDEPAFTAGGNVTVNEDSGAYSAAWASAISAGPNETQTLTFHVTNDNNALFASQPAISATGVLTFTTASDAFGTATVTVYLTDDGGTANSGDDTSSSVTFTITLDPVNDAPSFTGGANQTVLEDSGAQTVAGWATNISAGPANESGQSLTFSVVSNSNPSLFSAGPAIAADGTLTYTPAANASGSATIVIHLQDNGGTANGGADTSATYSFTITVTPVNDAPSFTSGGDVTVNEDSGAYSAAWATAISAGPNESGQTLNFVVSNTNNALFSAQPAISPSGVLTFTPAANAFGTATISVTLHDNGGTANGGADTSATVNFVITVTSVNDGPTAGNDFFETFGNTEIRVDLGAVSTPHVLATTPSGTGVLHNDTDPENDPYSITSIVGCGDTTAPFDCTLAGGAKVSMNANGSFSYTPAPGATSGSFQYVVTDNPPVGSPASSTGTVTFTITNMIWYVNANYPLVGNGTSNAPFANFASLNGGPDADNPGDTIFVHNSTVSGSIIMEANQHLLGEGVGLTVLNSSFVPYTLVAPGTKPRILGGAADAVTVTGVTGVEVAGLELNSTGGSGIEVRSNVLGAATSATIHDNFVNGAAQQGILVDANSSAGTSAIISTTNVVSTGTGVHVKSTAGAVAFSYSNGTVTSTGARGIDVDGTLGGTITINGLSNVSVSGTTATDGIRVAKAAFAVSGANVAVGSSSDPVGANGIIITQGSGTLGFGALDSYAGNGAAVSATSLGAFTITSASGNLRGTNGAGLSLTSTTIGASGMILTSISSTGGVNGIVLNTTGSTGSLTVTGTGTTAGSGGSLSGNTGDAIVLTSTTSPSLSYMNVSNAGNNGINATTVSGLSLIGCDVSNSGNASGEHGLKLTNVGGTVAINGSTFNNAAQDLVHMDNASTNVTVTVSNGSQFSFPTTVASSANAALWLASSGTTSTTVSVTGSTFTNVPGSSMISTPTLSGSSGTHNVTFSNNTVNVNLPNRGSGVIVDGRFNTTTSYLVQNNQFNGAGGNGVIGIDANDNGFISGTISGNALVSPAGHAIFAAADGNATNRTVFDSNTIQNAGGDGFQLVNFGGTGTSTTDFIVTNNVVDGHSQNGSIAFVGGIGFFSFEDNACVAVKNNTVLNTPSGYFDVYMEEFGGTNTKLEEVPDTAATAASSTYVSSINSVNAANVSVNGTIALTNGTLCTRP